MTSAAGQHPDDPTGPLADPPATTGPIVVAALCLRDGVGRVLSVRKRGTTAFMLPGGKVEPGETPVAAALREVREEVGLDVVDAAPLGCFSAPAANEPGRTVTSTVLTASLPPGREPEPAGEIEELCWVDPAVPEVPGGTVLAPLTRDHVLPALLAGGPRVAVVGIGADGWAGLPGPVRERLAAAPAVLGSERQLALLPPVAGQRREAWGRPFRDSLVELVARHGGAPGARDPVAVLASGDPLVSGVATTLVRLLGPERVEVVPSVSSVALARARMGWAAEEHAVVTVVGRRVERVLRELAPGRRVVVLSSDAATPATLAGLLVGAGHGGSRMTVLADLGAPEEGRYVATAATWGHEVPALNVVCLEVDGHAGPGASWATGLPDDAYDHDGQLTKRDLRASALARLAPRPGALLWDVGAGAGSVGIEWMRAHPTCRAVAVERDPARAARIRANAARLGVPDLEVVEGPAPDALAGLPAPDAVFVGGGATAPGLLETCLAALRPGGRLVVHGVTLETEQVLARAHGEHGGELARLAVEHAAPVGGFTGWTPARTVTQWAWTRPT